MEESQFDKSLRDFVASSELPYDGAQWTRLASRLDEDKNKAVIAPPVPQRRTIPLRRVLLPAAAACLLFAVLWIGRQNNETVPDVAQSQQAAPARPLGQSISPTDSSDPVSISAASHPVPGNVRLDDKPRKEVPGMPQQIDTATATVAAIAPGKDIADTGAKALVAVLPKKPEATKPLQVNLAQEGPDDIAKPASGGRLAFGVLGGYNVGDAKAAFTVGVSVAKPLGSRLQLETGLALVSGAYQTYREVPQPPGTPGTLSKEYEEASNRLLYVQAAPTLGYRITDALSAGAGLDAQRLLSKAASAVVLNGIGKEGIPQPLWDFGLTAKLDYRLASRLKAGMTYRKSMQSTNGGSGAAARDYLQLQVGYLIFR